MRVEPGSDKRNVSGALHMALPLILGTVVAAVGLSTVFGGSQTNFEELALGAETSSYFAAQGGYPIHCSGVAGAEKCLMGARVRNLPVHALWLGNSQVHSINQFRDGDENAPPLLSRRLNARGIDLLTFSQPNANLQEHLILYAYLQQRLSFDVLILPVVFDDLRETGLRADVAAALEDAAVRVRVGEHCRGAFDHRAVAGASRGGHGSGGRARDVTRRGRNAGSTHGSSATRCCGERARRREERCSTGCTSCATPLSELRHRPSDA